MINIEVHSMAEDFRPAIVLDNVQGADFINLKARHTLSIPTFLFKKSGTSRQGYVLKSPIIRLKVQSLRSCNDTGNC